MQNQWKKQLTKETINLSKYKYFYHLNLMTSSKIIVKWENVAIIVFHFFANLLLSNCKYDLNKFYRSS